MKKNEMDYATLAAIAAPQKSGGFDLATLFRLYEEHKDLVGKLVGFIGGFLHHKSNPGTVPAPTLPVLPPLPNPTPVPAPAGPPIPAPAPTPFAIGSALISTLRLANHLGVFFVEEWKNGPGTSKPVDMDRMNEILGGGQVTRGASIHYNFSPIDQGGREILTNDPRHAQVNGGSPYLEFQVQVEGGPASPWMGPNGGVGDGWELHQGDSNWGCTPRIKIPADATGSRHRELRLRARVVNGGPTSDWTQTVSIP